MEERGFLDMLRDLISDSNPMVVANAVASLNEISDMSGKEAFEITQSTLFKLIAAMNECTEWGQVLLAQTSSFVPMHWLVKVIMPFVSSQVFILDVLSKYEAPDAHTAETIIERVTPRLQHGNPAVALSAIKVCFQAWLHTIVASKARVRGRNAHATMLPQLRLSCKICPKHRVRG